MGVSERSGEAADDLGTLGALDVDVAACHEGQAKKIQPMSDLRFGVETLSRASQAS